jgi:hypothetical protein
MVCRLIERRFDERLSHKMKINKVIESVEIYEPIDEIIFHRVKESG